MLTAIMSVFMTSVMMKIVAMLNAIELDVIMLNRKPNESNPFVLLSQLEC